MPNKLFGKKVNVARLEQKISLKELAELSKVSASMLSSIERGEKMPSLRVALMIANALGRRLADLIEPEKEAVMLVRKSEWSQVYTDSGEFRQTLSPLLATEGVDVVFRSMPPRGGIGSMGGYNPGSIKFVFVLKGRLKAIVNGTIFVLDEGDAISYKADVRHEFSNLTEAECEYVTILRI